jgi:pimeloyl-ACP methyl ester carboxylesterase
MPKLTIDDITLNYQCIGEGEETLVLIHGLGASFAFWYLRIASVLAQHYRIIIYDLRGHGESSMPTTGYSLSHMTQDLHSLIEHLQVKKMHLVGHSFGATVALHYTVSYPNKVATLTLADTHISCLQAKVQLCDWPYWKLWKQKFIELGVPLPADEEFIGIRLLSQLNQFSTASVQKGQLQTTDKSILRTFNMGKRTTERLEKLLNTTFIEKELDESEPTKPDQIKSITIPVLGNYGEYSYCLPSCWKLKNLIPDYRIVIVPQVGHFHPTVKPELFTATLQAFLMAHSYIH